MSENEIQQWHHPMTLLYGWSHSVGSNEARLDEARHLYMEVASLPNPLVQDITRGVNEACSTSRMQCS